MRRLGRCRLLRRQKLPRVGTDVRRAAAAVILFALMARGSDLFVINSAYALCDNHDPTTGETTTCSPPVPDTVRVGAVAGSTNVTVNILAGAAINVVNINGVFLHDQS